MYMLYLVILYSFFSLSSFASEIKVLNFNTMCDICSGSSREEFPERIKLFQSIIKIYSPNLIALQEVRTASQVKEIIKNFPHYKYYTLENSFISYADPTVIYDSSRFELLNSFQKWLGPTPDGFISIGWKWALPRQIIGIKLKDKKTSEVFYFLSSHFDNRIENLRGATKLVQKTIANLDAPALFAADTNTTVDMPEYKDMLGTNLFNAFDQKNELSLVGQYKKERELCYTRKGKKFPECRVDHVLYTKDFPWKARSFLIDTLKMENGKFPSDHRPVIVKFDYKN